MYQLYLLRMKLSFINSDLEDYLETYTPFQSEPETIVFMEDTANSLHSNIAQFLDPFFTSNLTFRSFQTREG